VVDHDINGNEGRQHDSVAQSENKQFVEGSSRQIPNAGLSEIPGAESHRERVCRRFV